MKCPKGCDALSRVIDSRRVLDGAATRRRRECVACGARFTTYERRSKPPTPPAASDPAALRQEILYLRAALAQAKRGELSMIDAALAGDWRACAGLCALAIVVNAAETRHE